MDNCLVLKVEGRINSRNTPFFRRSMMKGINPGFAESIFVLDDMEKSPSRVLRILAQVRKAAADKGVHIWSMSSPGGAHPVLMRCRRILRTSGDQ
jgi:hypothetical protein